MRLRLFCIPHAGGGATTFRAWGDDLPAGTELCAVQLPGREERLREPLRRRMTPLVEELAGQIRTLLDVPFALLGHSMGALVAFELARQLRRSDGPLPVHLFAVGRRAPQLPEPLGTVFHLPDDELLDELRHRYGGIPDVLIEDAELRAVFLPILRADVEVVDTYVYRREPPLECPITAICGQDDVIGERDLAAWQQQTSAPFAMEMLPGGHFVMETSGRALREIVARELRVL